MAEPECVYVLRSLSDHDRYYTGVTSDLDARLSDHNAGRCPHTADGRPCRTGLHRPSSNAAFIPARVRSERTSILNRAKAASTPSISLPVDVSSIGSVADRSEMPSDYVRTQSEVVVLVAREAREVEHDHEVHTALVQPAERQQGLKLTAVGGLGAFAFLVEPVVQRNPVRRTLQSERSCRPHTRRPA
jgi:hypothetical protein